MAAVSLDGLLCRRLRCRNPLSQTADSVGARRVFWEVLVEATGDGPDDGLPRHFESVVEGGEIRDPRAARSAPDGQV
jgi:hypothetical protein